MTRYRPKANSINGRRYFGHIKKEDKMVETLDRRQRSGQNFETLSENSELNYRVMASGARVWSF